MRVMAAPETIREPSRAVEDIAVTWRVRRSSVPKPEGGTGGVVAGEGCAGDG